MSLYRIQHKTTYKYQYPVTVSHHSAHLKPLTGPEQTCQSFTLSISPGSTDVLERLDYFGNASHLFSIQERHSTLVVDAQSVVKVLLSETDLESINISCGTIRAAMAATARADLLDAKQFLYPTELTPRRVELDAFARRFLADDQMIGTGLSHFLQAFRDEFTFDPDATEISTPVMDVFEKRRGVCQDFAHLMIAALKSSGIAACYMSGYILTHPKEGEERLVGADASHAWLAVYIPEFGWVEIDPTNNLVCSNQHVRVAQGRDYGDVSMLSGAVTGGGEQKITVEVTVVPLEE